MKIGSGSRKFMALLMVLFLAAGMVLTASAEEMTVLKLPDDTTVIEDEAFMGDTSITSVIFPEGLEQIGANAFRNCTGLTGSITLAGGIQSIGSGAFAGCDSLSEIVIRSSEEFVTYADDTFPDNADIVWTNEFSLNGKHVFIYDWWSGGWDDYIEEYDCTVTWTAKGDWGTNAVELANFVSDPDGTLCLFVLPQDFILEPMANGMLAPWNGNSLIDLSASKWNSATVNFMTVGGTTYGVSVGKSDPRQCVYFNKRVLEEAGVNWESIYDMQANGTWTWNAFESLLNRVQRDTDGDGKTDIYGMTGSSMDLFRVAVFANGGSFFDFDGNGDLAITAGSENTLDALAWSKNLWNTYTYPQPEDASWDYYKDLWEEGNCGFYVNQAYAGFLEDVSEMLDMEDPWGCVAFPMGPNGNTYVNIVSENITVIPNVYDAKTTAALAHIYDLVTGDDDDSYSWIGNMLELTDRRAVMETYGMLREPAHCVVDKVAFLGSVNEVEGMGFLWELGESTPEQIVAAKTPEWQEMLDAFNNGR